MQVTRSPNLPPLKHRIKRVVSVTVATVFMASYGVLTMVTPVQAAAAPGKLYLSPATISVAQGATVAVQVRLDTGGEVMNGVQANFTYPSNLVTYASISDAGSGFGISTPSTGANGAVSVARADFNGAKGDVLVITVNFRATGLGSGEFKFTSGSEAYRPNDTTNAVGSTVGAKITVGAANGAAPTTPPAATPNPVGGSTTNGGSKLGSTLSALPSDDDANAVDIDNNQVSSSDLSSKGPVWWPIPVVLVLVAGGIGAAVYLQRRQSGGYDGYDENFAYDIPAGADAYAPPPALPNQSVAPVAPIAPAALARPAAVPPASAPHPAVSRPAQPPTQHANGVVESSIPRVAPTAWQPTLPSMTPPAVSAPSSSVNVPPTPAQPVRPISGPTPATAAKPAPFGPPAAQAPSTVVNPANNQLPR